MLGRDITEEDLIEIFKKLPKESFELTLRNVSIREHLENVWKKYQISGRIERDENFEKIFDEIFKFFFRPLEIFLAGESFLKYLLPKPDIISIFEAQREVLEAYEDFVRSYLSHMKLTAELLMGYAVSETAKNLAENFARKWWDFVKKSYRLELDAYRILSEYPFIISKDVSNNLFKATEHWNEFRKAFFEFKDLIARTYNQSVEEFIELANTSKIDDFSSFTLKFAETVARKFDDLIKSEKYLNVQKRMLDNLMDYVYSTRKYFEALLESSPINPFATISQIDEAYKRITDLKRKIRELEHKLNLLERRLGGENVGKSEED